MRRSLYTLVFALVWLATASTAAAGGLLVGAAEDDAKQPDISGAKAKMDLAALAGFNAIRVTALWQLGQTRLDGGELLLLQNAAAAANLDGIRLIVSIYPTGSRATPRTARARADFARYAASVAHALPTVKDFIIGNEPNLNRFWLPQFNPDGSNAAAPAYERLLAGTYDALKAVNPSIHVIGGSVSPRGGDSPRSKRPTHSPTTFIRDLGTAYRKSGRRRPIMDAFAFHPYLDSSRIPPTFRHPRSTTVALNDYGKLVGLLRKAFDGTPQPGSRLPIIYDEFGVQSRVGPPKIHLYQNRASAVARDAVPETTQAAYYRKALELASCQPTVFGLLFLHVRDEDNLAAWQSGLYYPDDRPKSSLPAVRKAAEAARAGAFAADCAPAKSRTSRG